VTGFGGGVFGRLLERIGLTHPGIRVAFADASLDDPHAGPGGTGITIDLDLTVAYGVPVAEVARQVDSAVRYAIRRALDRKVDRLTIHVDGLRYQPGDLPAHAPPDDPSAIHSDDLAASGTDVA
jgi:hypothetical protein